MCPSPCPLCRQGQLCAQGRVSNLTDCPQPMRGERERLVRNIGIEYRRVAQPWQCFSDLVFDATQSLLDGLGWAREEVECINLDG